MKRSTTHRTVKAPSSGAGPKFQAPAVGVAVPQESLAEQQVPDERLEHVLPRAHGVWVTHHHGLDPP